jgi:hypothetical protein
MGGERYLNNFSQHLGGVYVNIVLILAKRVEDAGVTLT